MDTDWPPNYKTWMREDFPRLNLSLDNELSADALASFAEASLPIAYAIARDTSFDERERFTYISMMHSAAYHHQKRAAEAGIAISDGFAQAYAQIQQTVIALADAIGVEHRFLSAFYLFYNPEMPEFEGTFAQFRPTAYETAFLRINSEGSRQYKIGAEALFQAYERLSRPSPSSASILPLLEQARTAFWKISHGNQTLLDTPGGKEFKFITQYFGEVRVAGRTLRGVSAGDQPWSYMIDLLLGVDLKHVFERAFEGTAIERHYPDEVRTSADAIAYEFSSQAYLRANYLLPEDYAALTKAIALMNRLGETLPSAIRMMDSDHTQSELAERLHDVVTYYVAASNVHYQLAQRYVPKTNGEQIGSAGTNIVKFLKEGLNAERENVKREIEERYPELSRTETENIIA